MRALLQMAYGENDDFWHGGIPDNCAVNILSAEDGKLTFLAEDKIYYDPALSNNPYAQYH